MTDHAIDSDEEVHPLSQDMAWALGVSNWTANMTYGTPKSLLNRVDEYQEPESVNQTLQQSWYKPYPATLSIIILLHVIFLLQWNRRRTKKQCLVSYRQLIQKRQYYRGVVAILSHPAPVDIPRRSDTLLSIDFGNAESPGDPRWARLRSVLHPLTHGHLSGLPLLVYNCHLLWTCRALEPMFPTSWHYVRSLIGLATLALAVEVRFYHVLAHRTAPFQAANRFRSIQPDFGTDPIVRTRKLILHRTMGTCTALMFAVMFLYRLSFVHIQLQIVPILWIPCIPWLSYLLCCFLLIVLSWRQHAITSCFAGSFAGFLWIIGFHFLGKLYWGTWMILSIAIASLVSLKHSCGDRLSVVDYVAWDAQGIIRFDGVPILTSVLTSPQEEDVEEDDDDEAITPDSEANSIVDVENPRRSTEIRGHIPLMNLDEEEDQPLLPSHNGLTRRGAGSSHGGNSD